jgi:hypothetical protein
MMPSDLQLYVREQLARIDQLHADAERKRQECPGLYRIEIYVLTAMGAGAVLFAASATFFKLLL